MKKRSNFCKRLILKIFTEESKLFLLNLNVLCTSESYIEIKIKLNFYFHTSLQCLKRFYEGFFLCGVSKGFIKLS